MHLRPSTALLILAMIPLLGSCNDNEFAGSDGGAKSSEEDAGEGGPGCSEAPKEGESASLMCGTNTTNQDPPACVDGDKVNIQWTGPEKDCFDQGKTYNFEEKKCAEMRQAQFECNWSAVKGELEKLGLLTDVLRNDADGGAKLVSCGSSADGMRIVVQWIKPSDVQGIDCAAGASSGSTVTGCYTKYGAGEVLPPPAANKEERSKQVYECMNQL